MAGVLDKAKEFLHIGKAERNAEFAHARITELEGKVRHLTTELAGVQGLAGIVNAQQRSFAKNADEIQATLEGWKENAEARLDSHDTKLGALYEMAVVVRGAQERNEELLEELDRTLGSLCKDLLSGATTAPVYGDQEMVESRDIVMPAPPQLDDGQAKFTEELAAKTEKVLQGMHELSLQGVSFHLLSDGETEAYGAKMG